MSASRTSRGTKRGRSDLAARKSADINEIRQSIISLRELGKKRLAATTPAGKKMERTAMAAERSQNLQDTFLNHVRKAKIPLTIFLVNGVKLQGVVTWFDNFCVLLRGTDIRSWSTNMRFRRSCRVIRSSCSKAPRKAQEKRPSWSHAAAMPHPAV